jgi:hypothetical protein
MLLARLSFCCVIPHGVGPCSGGFVPKLFPSFGMNDIVRPALRPVDRTKDGPEFISRYFLAWCVERKIELVHIEPGKPVQNAHVESFHAKLGDECLNASWFQNLFAARQKIAAWRREYKRGTAAQFVGVCGAGGVRPSSGSAPVAYGSLRAPTRPLPRDRSGAVRSSRCRMIGCAEIGGWSFVVGFGTPA